LILTLLLLCAQPSPGQGGAEEPSTEAAVEAPVVVPVTAHHSPRAAMKAFIEGMRRYWFQQSFEDEDLQQALSALDLRGEEAAPEQLRELAIRLYEVLNRVARVDLASFPLTVGEPSCSVTLRDARGLGSGVVLDFTRVAGGPEAGGVEDWRLAKSTLARVPEWWQRFGARSVVRELSEVTAEDEATLTKMQRLGLELERRVPGALRDRTLLLENWQWLALALVSLFGVLLGRLVSFVLRRVTARLVSSERVSIDRGVLAGFERPFSLFVMVWMILFARPAMRLGLVYAEVIDLGCAFFLAITGVWSAYRLVDLVAHLLQKKALQTANRFDDMLVPLMRRTSKLFLTLAGAIYVASYISDDLYGVVAGLSIGSLAVGFAAKDSIENLFGTVTVLMDKPYQLGDWVRVGDIDGSVEEVGFRSTKIRTFYNSVITVPNSRFIAAHVDNMGARRYRRIKTMVTLAYATPPLRIEAFCEAVRELIRKHPYTRKDYYHVYLNELSASSLDVLVYCFVETPDWSTELREKHRLYLDILKVAAGLGVEIAFPTQTLHVAKEAAPLDPLADDVRGAERMGRELADLIVREELEPFGGEKPPPVVID
jgi:MscS family membrane protein